MNSDEDTDDDDLEMNHENHDEDEIALVKKHVAPNTLKKIIMHRRETEDEIDDNGGALNEGSLQLLAAHKASLRHLEIHDLYIGNIWKGTKFPNLKKLWLHCEGEHSLLLKQCPTLQELKVGGGDAFCLDKRLVLPSLKKLTLSSLYYYTEIGHMLKNMPRLEELAVEDCYIFILNRNFNLSSLKKLYLKSVEIGKNTKCILEAKLPSTMSLDLEQYEYCNVLDDDDFFRLAPPVPTDFYLEDQHDSSILSGRIRALLTNLF